MCGALVIAFCEFAPLMFRLSIAGGGPSRSSGSMRGNVRGDRSRRFYRRAGSGSWRSAEDRAQHFRMPATNLANGVSGAVVISCAPPPFRRRW